MSKTTKPTSAPVSSRSRRPRRAYRARIIDTPNGKFIKGGTYRECRECMGIGGHYVFCDKAQ